MFKEKKLLLVYYHPIIFDLAESFSRLFGKVEIACKQDLKDNYGGYKNVEDRGKALGLDVIPLSLAIVNMNGYDLVGVDGVFDGDALAMQMCRETNTPYFCINGYPHQVDEIGQNILAFSWFLPQIQHKKMFPHEGYLKELTWKQIAENGQEEGKNICVYYPEMNEAKHHKFSWGQNSSCINSFIHRYEEYNHWNYRVFCKVKERFPDLNIQNYSGLTQKEVYEKMDNSFGTLHLKHGDCPGISVLESLIFGKPVFTMSTFVKSSFNQEVLIDGFNSIIADSYDELIERIENYYTNRRTYSIDKYFFDSQKIRQHVYMLTDFQRQKNKLVRFFERCLNE